ncbi:MAG: glutamyl-tRNA reductase [Bacillota bacterium]
MQIGLISFSFKNTPIEIREKISFSSGHYQKAYNLLNKSNMIKESIIISTCNRTEIYFISDKEFNQAEIYIQKVLINIFELKNEEILKNHGNYKKGVQVIKHLMEVAGACRSQVIGEQQILGQVKDEYQQALKYEASGRYLNYFFKEAISTSKKIRSETQFCEKSLSLSSVAISFIESKIERFNDKKVLVVGIGKMSRLVIDILKKKGVNIIYATNRTHHKVVKVSDYYKDVIPVNYDELHQKIPEVDIVISSTSAPHFVIHFDKLKKYYKKEALRPIIMIDLGVPRDIEPEIKRRLNLDIYNLDDLNIQREKNREYRLANLESVQKIINKKLKSINEWIQWQQIVPVIKNIKESNTRIIEKELHTLYDIIDPEPEIKKEINKFARYLAKNLFNDIILNLKELSINKEIEIEKLEKIFNRGQGGNSN